MAEFVSELERRVGDIMANGATPKQVVEFVLTYYTDPRNLHQSLDDGGCWEDLPWVARVFVANVMRAELELPGLQ